VYKNGYYYYKKTESGKQYFKYCRKRGLKEKKEEVLLDVNKMAEGHPYYKIGGMEVSDDNRFLAYAVDEGGRLQYDIYIKDLNTGQILKDKITRTQGDHCWANDNSTLFYTSNNPVTLLSEKIKRHTIGEEQTKDVTVYEEKDNSNYISVYKTKNGKYIFIKSEGTLSSEYQLLEANKPYESFRSFQKRLENVLYTPYAVNGGFLMLTNKDNARNFKIMRCSENNTSSDAWLEYRPHDSQLLLESLDEFSDFIIIKQRRIGREELIIKKLSDDTESALSFPEDAYTVDIETLPDFKSHVFRYRYSSLVIQPSVMEYDITTSKIKLIKKMAIGGEYDPSRYTSERILVTVRDGALVPLTVVYKKGFLKNGQAPLLLYGYGSYGYSTEDAFSSNRLSLLDRGFAFAIAHIRGGQEMGRQWYEDGKLLKKKNTFYDFIDCAEYLTANNFTSRKHLYAMGRSAGGLLMGAVATMAPELWNGIIAEVPFVDVINTMLDENIPLTTNEFDEWGNPKDKSYYNYMNSYNPYENVRAVNYPNILVTTGLHDSQVQYFEPQKWVAKLRATKTDNNLLLLHTNMDYGHGGASGRFDYLKGVALNYAFLLSLEGIRQ
jgi:oligopeptidase B